MARKHIFWKLFFAYWSSERRWRGIGMMLTIVALTYVEIWSQKRFSVNYGEILDALQKRDTRQFGAAFASFLFAMTLLASSLLASTYVQQLLNMDWRTALTDAWVQRWLDNDTIYRIEREQGVDNPDQRIAEDVKLFVDSTMKLGFGLIAVGLGLWTYMGLLWQMGGSTTISVAALSWTIPGYLVWLSVIFAVLTTWITRWVGKPLVPLNQNQQHVEADFRFGLIQVRVHAEQVAFYRGAAMEHARIGDRFEAIRRNWWSLVAYQLRLGFVGSIFDRISNFLLFGLLAPRVFSGQLTAGSMITLQQNFTATLVSLNWFARSWNEIVVWLAIVGRLDGLDRAIDAERQTGITVAPGEQASLSTHGLALDLPDGEALADIGDFAVAPGQRWLVRGPSGAGKSTLLRAIAGLWPYGGGRIDQPRGTMLFLPQRSYLPAGTLKATLTYPMPPESFSDEACWQALIDCRLGRFSEQLAEECRWEQLLSPGEQQRIAFARAILIRPDFLFLDESTSALDNATEQHLYRLLLERLPRTALISVAHRTTLDAFHTHRLNVDGMQRVAL